MIHYKPGVGYFVFGKSKAFRHIMDLIHFYNQNPLTGTDTCLVFPADKPKTSAVRFLRSLGSTPVVFPATCPPARICVWPPCA
jgi:hypothetical protein